MAGESGKEVDVAVKSDTPVAEEKTKEVTTISATSSLYNLFPVQPLPWNLQFLVILATSSLYNSSRIIRFISHAVISGFTTASAIVIALSQAKYFLGYDIDSTTEIVPLIESIISGISEFTWQPFVMGSCILAILLVMKHFGKTRKNLRFLQAAAPLTAIVLGTAIVKIFDPSSISVVGEIPQGLPTFSVPQGFAYFKKLIPTAFLITGVAILESVGIDKALAAKNGYELDANLQFLVILATSSLYNSSRIHPFCIQAVRTWKKGNNSNFDVPVDGQPRQSNEHGKQHNSTMDRTTIEGGKETLASTINIAATHPLFLQKIE